MTPNTIPNQSNTLPFRHEWSVIEKLALRRAHPQSIIINLISLIWFTYTFWRHEWVYAIGAIVLGRISALLLVKKPNFDSLADTTLGKLALLHLHPANMTIQIAGAALTLLSLWTQLTPLLLTGISVIFVGHWFGWSKVHPSLTEE